MIKTQEKKTSLLPVVFIYQAVFMIRPHLFSTGPFPYLLHKIRFHFTVIQHFVFPFIFLHEARFIPCSEERISHFLQCFSRLSSISNLWAWQKHSDVKWGKYVQTLPEFRHAADCCCHLKEKNYWEPSLVCFFYHLRHQGRWDILPKAFPYASWQQRKSNAKKTWVVTMGLEANAALVDTALGPLPMT